MIPCGERGAGSLLGWGGHRTAGHPGDGGIDLGRGGRGAAGREVTVPGGVIAGREEQKVRHKPFIPGPCEVDEKVLAARRRHEEARRARMR